MWPNKNTTESNNLTRQTTSTDISHVLHNVIPGLQMLAMILEATTVLLIVFPIAVSETHSPTVFNEGRICFDVSSTDIFIHWQLLHCINVTIVTGHPWLQSDSAGRIQLPRVKVSTRQRSFIFCRAAVCNRVSPACETTECHWKLANES